MIAEQKYSLKFLNFSVGHLQLKMNSEDGGCHFSAELKTKKILGKIPAIEKTLNEKTVDLKALPLGPIQAFFYAQSRQFFPNYKEEVGLKNNEYLYFENLGVEEGSYKILLQHKKRGGSYKEKHYLWVSVKGSQIIKFNFKAKIGSVTGQLV